MVSRHAPHDHKGVPRELDDAAYERSKATLEPEYDDSPRSCPNRPPGGGRTTLADVDLPDRMLLVVEPIPARTAHLR